MSDTTHEYGTSNPAMQAIVCALMFGEKAGMAAMAAVGSHILILEDGGLDASADTIQPEANVVVHLDPKAVSMLALSQTDILDNRHDGHSIRADRVNHLDIRPHKGDDFEHVLDFAESVLGRKLDEGEVDQLRDALRDADEAAEVDMSEVTPGNTDKVYTDQPVPPREA